MKNLIRRPLKRAAYALFPLERLRFADYAREWAYPRNLPEGNHVINVPERYFGHEGIDLNEDAQLATLRGWKDLNPALIETLRKDPRINTKGLGRPLVHNGMYHTPDAEIYASMILQYNPPQIIELGGGFSSLIARKTLQSQARPGRLVVIDPQPRTDVDNVVDVVIRQFVEDVDLKTLHIERGTILFIDSSHICRAGGDIPLLFCKIIPSLPAGVLVHVHDIFLPFDYPYSYQKQLWNEQYVLHALLAHAQKFNVVFATHFMTRTHLKEMQEVFGQAVGVDKDTFGASFWFRT
jgi:hypothetical protein